MITAFAVNGDRMADTLGTASEFLLLEDDVARRIPRSGTIPLQLKDLRAEQLVCSGIGNCMMDLLTGMGFEVSPGVDGEIAEVLRQYRSGALLRGEKYSCADRGMTCGACSGSF